MRSYGQNELYDNSDTNCNIKPVDSERLNLSRYPEYHQQTALSQLDAEYEISFRIQVFIPPINRLKSLKRFIAPVGKLEKRQFLIS